LPDKNKSWDKSKPSKTVKESPELLQADLTPDDVWTDVEESDAISKTAESAEADKPAAEDQELTTPRNWKKVKKGRRKTVERKTKPANGNFETEPK
jgi:hypothetical protein